MLNELESTGRRPHADFVLTKAVHESVVESEDDLDPEGLFPPVVKGHPGFLALLDEMRQTHIKKGTDYSNPDDILANLRGCESLGVPSWMGVMVRIGDKFARITNMARKKWMGQGGPAVKDESIRDTLLDLASYALLAIILMFEDARAGAGDTK